MRNFKNFVLITAMVLSVFGCRMCNRNQVPKDAVPVKAGVWTTTDDCNSDIVPEYCYGSYTAPSRSDASVSRTIKFQNSMLPEAADFQQWLKGSAECWKTVETGILAKEIIKEETIKDKTGKTVGEIKICRQREIDLGKSFGGYSYLVAIKNNNLVSVYNALGGLGEKAISLSELSDFIKNIPYHANLDLSVLSAQNSDSFESHRFYTAQQIANFAPPVQIVAKPYLKPKVIFVQDESMNRNYFDYDQNDLLAEKPEEIQTIIQIKCDKGKRIGTYAYAYSEVAAYENVCQAKIIDVTIPAVIAQKSFSDRTLPKKIEFHNQTEYIAPNPADKMRDFFKSLPQK